MNHLKIVSFGYILEYIYDARTHKR